MADENKEVVTKPSNIEPFKPKKKLGKKVLLILLLVLLLAGGFGAGWWSQQSKIKQLKNDKEAAEEKAKKAGEKSSEAEAEVVRVQLARPEDRSFSVEMPLDWFSGTCGESLLFVADSEDRLGKCNTEYFGMFSFASSDGDTSEPASTYTDSDDYADVTVEAVTIDGIAGTKISYRFVGESIVGYPATGSRFVRYLLYNGTKTFSATYDRVEGEADLSAEFTDMVESLDTTP